MNYSDNISVRIRPEKVIKYMFAKDGATSIVSIASAGMFAVAVIKFIRFLCDNTTATGKEAWSFCLTGGLAAALFSITYFLEKCRLEEAAEERLREKKRQSRQRQIRQKEREKARLTADAERKKPAEKAKSTRNTSKTYMEGQKQKRKIS